jgi:replicative DNA helicase
MNNLMYDLMAGKLPPQALEMEEAVLGAILLEPHSYGRVASLLRSDMFYRDSNRCIYEAIESLSKAGAPIDILTVTQFLRTNGKLEVAGGPLRISQLTTPITSSATVEYNAMLVLEKFLRRSLIGLGQQAQELGFREDEDVFNLIATVNRGLSDILTKNIKRDAVHISELQRDAINDIYAREKEGYSYGIPFGIQSIDKVLGGAGRGDLIYIGARPGMGKTALIISAALAQAKQGVPVLMFSLEMTKAQFNFRMLSTLTEINLERLMKQRLDPDEVQRVQQAIGILEKLPIYIDDTPALNVWRMKAIVGRMRERHDVKIAYVDYVQLVTTERIKGQIREQELSEISRTLKQIGKENDIPMIVLAQLSRAVESRPDKRPILSDLRESGSLEQDADAVAFLYRPEYYGIVESENGEPTHGMAEFIVAKNRHGSCNTVKIGFKARTTTFHEFGYEPTVPKETPHPDARIEPNRDFLSAPIEEPPF